MEGNIKVYRMSTTPTPTATTPATTPATGAITPVMPATPASPSLPLPKSIARFTNWELRLESFLRSLLVAPRTFEYGVWDCCLFPASAIHVMTGVDLAASLRGQYDSRRSVQALIQRRLSFPSPAAELPDLISKITAAHGVLEIQPALASRGDLVCLRRPLGFSLGLVSLKGTSVLIVGEDRHGAQGIGSVPLSEVERAWRI